MSMVMGSSVIIFHATSQGTPVSETADSARQYNVLRFRRIIAFSVHDGHETYIYEVPPTDAAYRGDLDPYATITDEPYETEDGEEFPPYTLKLETSNFEEYFELYGDALVAALEALPRP